MQVRQGKKGRGGGVRTETDTPEELREIAAALLSRALPEMDSAARVRILAAVRAALAVKARSARWSWWRFAAASAALVVLWANLSISAVNWTEISLSPWERRFDERAALAQIQGLLPGCSAQEAQRQLLVLHARTRLVGVPQFHHARPDTARDL